MIDDRQLRDYVEGDLSVSARHALEASLPFDKVAQRLLGDQLQMHHALQTLNKGSAERARVRRRILEELGLPTKTTEPVVSEPFPSDFPPENPRAVPRSQQPKRRFPLILLIAAGVTVLASLIFLLWQPKSDRPNVGHLFRMQGELSIVRNGTPLSHSDGLILLAKDVVSLADNSKGLLVLGDGSEIDIGGPAVLVADAAGRNDEEAIELKFDRGEFTVSLKSRLRRPLIVRTPHLVIAPGEGQFRLQIDSLRTYIAVDRGALELILGDGYSRTLQPGDTFLAEPNGS